MNSTPKTSKSKAAADALDRGRDALRKQAWGAAFTQLSAADREAELEPADLGGLARAAYLTGREAYGAEILARAHQGFLSQGDVPGAARCAFWLAFALLNDGDFAQAGGWLARAHRVLADGQHDCVEQGFLLIPAGIRALREGDVAAAYATFVKAGAIGERFADNDLLTLARHGQGRALIRSGEIERGVSLLDEAMVAVTAGEVSPLVAGGVYCSVIEACSEIFDTRRAHEWTSALERWCNSQPEAVPYRGHCLVRRAEILQLQGAWADALEQAQQACTRLSEPTPKPGAGAAYYRMAELHRLRGEFAEAEEKYRQASQREPMPRPGLAQLRLAQGQLDAAQASIRHVADEAKEDGSRSRVLDAYVEIILAVNDIPAARAAAGELSQIAARFHSPLLDAVSACAKGAVLLAEKDSRGALTSLQQALGIWRELAAPYQAAQVQVLIALACREQGNETTAEMELHAARRVFEQLGAAPDLARVDVLLNRAGPKAEGPLTGRELEVLRQVASGLTNREIAAKLSISEKTVARHVSNIFTKLDLSSRAAATAYAYQHRLV